MFTVLLDPAGSATAPPSSTRRWRLSSGSSIAARDGFDACSWPAKPSARRAPARRTRVPVDGTTWQEILNAATKLRVDPQRVHAEAGLS